MIARSVVLTIAPPGAVCQVCRGGCVGEIVEVAPGTKGETWCVHADYTVCALVALFTYRRVER